SFGACSSPDTLPTLAEGSHTLQVRATDTAGNLDATPASYSWYVDLTAPSVSLSAPTDGANVAGSTWSTISSPWATGSLSDGQYDLRATATDNVGNSQASATVTVNVDNHAPVITFTAPGQYVNAASPASVSLTVTSTDTDIASVQFYECSNASSTCAGGTWATVGSPVTTSPWTTSWTPPAADGSKALKATATDNAGNSGSDSKTITIDRTAPSGVTISYPDGYSADGTVSIATGNGPDSDIAAATGQIEKRTTTLAGDSCDTAGWTAWTTLSGTSDTVADAHCAQYRYSVSDQAGNTTTTTGTNTVKVDETAPSGLSLSFSGLTRAFASGSTVFVKTGGTGGGFTVAAAANDAE
ncbi:MAG: Ig-like domain repeat protein, partial [Actinobacteria bacterium]|nr:Ig-like domain repeat protein [Actinomycetota bacterium]